MAAYTQVACKDSCYTLDVSTWTWLRVRLSPERTSQRFLCVCVCVRVQVDVWLVETQIPLGRRVAFCCSVSQHVAVCCSVLQCAAACYCA